MNPSLSQSQLVLKKTNSPKKFTGTLHVPHNRSVSPPPGPMNHHHDI